jgi:hypothetical protein
VTEVTEEEVDLRAMERERVPEVEERTQQADAAREFAHLDAHELRLASRAGVITLGGVLPSEEQHQMVRQYVTKALFFLSMASSVADIRGQLATCGMIARQTAAHVTSPCA